MDDRRLKANTRKGSMAVYGLLPQQPTFRGDLGKADEGGVLEKPPSLATPIIDRILSTPRTLIAARNGPDSNLELFPSLLPFRSFLGTVALCCSEPGPPNTAHVLFPSAKYLTGPEFENVRT